MNVDIIQHLQVANHIYPNASELFFILNDVINKHPFPVMSNNLINQLNCDAFVVFEDLLGMNCVCLGLAEVTFVVVEKDILHPELRQRVMDIEVRRFVLAYGCQR